MRREVLEGVENDDIDEKVQPPPAAAGRGVVLVVKEEEGVEEEEAVTPLPLPPPPPPPLAIWHTRWTAEGSLFATAETIGAHPL